MNDYDPTNPHETPPAQPVSGAKPASPVAGSSAGAGAVPPRPPASSPDWSAASTKQARQAGVRRSLPARRKGLTVAAALLVAVTGLSVALTTSLVSAPSASAETAEPSSPAPSGEGPRSEPAEGGAVGLVDSVSTSSFTLTTATGQPVTVAETSATRYFNGIHRAAACNVTSGDSVLVLGIVDVPVLGTTGGTTITAARVTVQPGGDGGAAAAAAAGVVPAQRGAPPVAKQVGEIPASYTEGAGTIVSGTTADKAAKAALAVYPGGVVNRVVKLSDGYYEVHNVAVAWPHHVFVDPNFTVVGAE
jgi:hypothetical protein